MTQIEAIAQDLFNQVRNERHPYNYLKWYVQSIGHLRYRATQDELWQAYFAAVNLLKSTGVENRKNKPLTNLTKEERQRLRNGAKSLATALQDRLSLPVSVTRRPLQDNGNGNCLQIAISYSASSAGFIYPTESDINRWMSLTPDQQVVESAKLAERFKSGDRTLAENIEVIKADLESLLSK